MQPESCVAILQTSRAFFDRSTSALTEKDAAFAPAENMMTVAQHIAHVAQSVEWFVEGTFRAEGFDTDYATRFAPVAADSNLGSVRDRLARAFDEACEAFGSRTEEDLAVALPAGEVMGGKPRWCVTTGIEEHTAHHRGALAVYARLCGRMPPAPYGP